MMSIIKSPFGDRFISNKLATEQKYPSSLYRPCAVQMDEPWMQVEMSAMLFHDRVSKSFTVPAKRLCLPDIRGQKAEDGAPTLERDSVTDRQQIVSVRS